MINNNIIQIQYLKIKATNIMNAIIVDNWSIIYQPTF